MINIKIKNKYIPNLRKKSNSLQSENLDISGNKKQNSISLIHNF